MSGLDVPSGEDDITTPRLHPDGGADTTGALAGNQSEDLFKCARLHDSIERPRCCSIANVRGLCAGIAKVLAVIMDAPHKSI